MARRAKKVMVAKVRRRFGEGDLPDEPSLDRPVIQAADYGLIRALNYYNHVDLKDKEDVLRRWLVTWAQTCPEFSKDEVRALERVEKWRITPGVAGLARMLTRGLELSPELMIKHVERVKAIIRRWTETQQVKTVREPKPATDQASDVIADIEEMWDEFVRSDYKSRFDVYRYLSENQVTRPVAKRVAEKYERVSQDFVLLQKGDKDMREAYSKLRKPQINSIVEQLATIVQDSERYYGNLKSQVVRKPRKRKEKSAAEQVKSMAYLKEFPDLKLVSVDPASIVGATSVWLYSVKYKVLRVLEGKLSVRGSTIHGWDPSLSQAKTLRKPDQVLAQVIGGTSHTVRKIMDGIKTKPQAVNGRVNSETIIVRAFR